VRIVSAMPRVAAKKGGCPEGHLIGTKRNPKLAGSVPSVHTSSMTLKSAALLALIGTILVTAVLVWDLIFNVLNVLQGLVPAVVLFRSLIDTFGAISVEVFFFVFHKRQA
jgi:hypothetical protein